MVRMRDLLYVFGEGDVGTFSGWDLQIESVALLGTVLTWWLPSSTSLDVEVEPHFSLKHDYPTVAHLL
jgi:hypothetical protein